MDDEKFKKDLSIDSNLSAAKSELNTMGGSMRGEVDIKGIVLIVNFACKREDVSETNMSSLEKQIHQKIKEKAQGKRILVVEDNQINEELAREVLTEVGFNVEAVNSGSDAIDIIKEKPEGYYDLVLMDIVMPGMDGYITTTLIRAINRPDIRNLLLLRYHLMQWILIGNKLLRAE